jgi:hypothetical protein
LKKDFAIPADDLINNWVKKVMTDPSLTEADTEELKTHLLDIMDELIEAGLDEEEAFIIASRRIGTIDDIEDEYRQENLEVIQTRRTAVVLSGVLIYFFSYHFIGTLSKLLFIILFTNDVPAPSSLFWMNRFLIFWHIIFILLFAGIILSEKKVVLFIENIKIRPKHTFILLISALFLAIVNVSLMSIAKSLIGTDFLLRGWFLKYLGYFEYSFPFLFCLGFILIYYRYYKKVRI